MTNPNNAVGTNAAYSGRTSVNAFNDLASAFTGRGIISGWGCEPSSGMTVTIGGDGSTRDVALAEDAAGNFTTVNNISASPIPVTIPAAPATNSRVDSIVAYVVKPPIGVSTETDNPAACGLIVVSGTASASPSAPNDSAIRTAITADGASGSTAYYVILANITVASGTTTLTATEIKQAVSPVTSNTTTADDTSVSSLAVNTETSIQSLTIPRTGKYKISAQFGGMSGASGVYTTILKIYRGSTVQRTFTWNTPGNDDIEIWIQNKVVAILDLAAGDTISDTVRIKNHSLSSVENCVLCAEQIG